jgi:hypothetical protein
VLWTLPVPQLAAIVATILAVPITTIERSDELTPFRTTIGTVSTLVGILLLLLSVVALMQRLRRAHGEQRQQLRWVSIAAIDASRQRLLAAQYSQRQLLTQAVSTEVLPHLARVRTALSQGTAGTAGTAVIMRSLDAATASNGAALAALRDVARGVSRRCSPAKGSPLPCACTQGALRRLHQADDLPVGPDRSIRPARRGGDVLLCR